MPGLAQIRYLNSESQDIRFYSQPLCLDLGIRILKNHFVIVDSNSTTLMQLRMKIWKENEKQKFLLGKQCEYTNQYSSKICFMQDESGGFSKSTIVTISHLLQINTLARLWTTKLAPTETKRQNKTLPWKYGKNKKYLRQQCEYAKINIQVYKYHAKQKSDGLLSQYKPSSIALVTEISNLLYLRACEVLN